MSIVKRKLLASYRFFQSAGVTANEAAILAACDVNCAVSFGDHLSILDGKQVGMNKPTVPDKSGCDCPACDKSAY
jgi:hypothetical protein